MADEQQDNKQTEIDKLKGVMENNLRQLNILREERERARERYEAKFEEFKKQNKATIDLLEKNKEDTLKTEESIRDKAVAIFKINGKKQLSFGVGIRLATVLEYDKEKALKWCVEHSMALKLDAPKFEKIAKADKIDFVEYVETPKATIPAKINLPNK